MGKSLCTSTQIDITKWYILPELLPKSKDKGFREGMLGNRKAHGEDCHFVGGQQALSVVRSQSSVVKDTLPNAFLATDNGTLTGD